MEKRHIDDIGIPDAKVRRFVNNYIFATNQLGHMLVTSEERIHVQWIISQLMAEDKGGNDE